MGRGMITGPNQAVQRTRASRSGQREFERRGRLAPVADLLRSAVAALESDKRAPVAEKWGQKDILSHFSATIFLPRVRVEPSWLVVA